MENRMSNKLPNQTKAHHTPRVSEASGAGREENFGSSQLIWRKIG